MVVLQAAFHSRVHKHSDDGTFELYRSGIPVVVDGGRFGYLGTTARNSDLRRQGFYYSDPSRIHVESTHAHNTVEIDGLTDNRADRPAYGSAITAAAARDNYFAVSMALVREPLVYHERVLLYGHRGWLLIIDWLDDLTGRMRDYTQWLQLHPSWHLTSESAQGFRFAREDTDWGLGVYPLGSDRPKMRVTRGAIVGDKEPQRREGWLSLSDGLLEPTSALGMSRHDGHAILATLIATDGPAVLDSRLYRSDASDRLGLTVEVEREREAGIQVRIARGPAHLAVAVREGPEDGPEHALAMPWKRSDRLQAADAFLNGRATARRTGADSEETRAAYERAVQRGSPDAALLLAEQAMRGTELAARTRPA